MKYAPCRSAPEKLSDMLNELQYLQERESLGELYIPNF